MKGGPRWNHRYRQSHTGEPSELRADNVFFLLLRRYHDDASVDGGNQRQEPRVYSVCGTPEINSWDSPVICVAATF